MLAESGSLGGRAKESFKKPAVHEPSATEVMYHTSNRQYSGSWHDSTHASMSGKAGECPRISDVLALRGSVRKPINPLINTAKSVLGNTVAQETEARKGDKVLSADVVPKKFPVNASEYTYPESAKKGAGNPLYQTSSQAYGKETPMDHQIPDRFFPSTLKFTNGFVDQRPRYTGLSTAWAPSRVHQNLDEYF